MNTPEESTLNLRQAMYICHIEVRSRIHCCCGKAINITYLCLRAIARGWVRACLCAHVCGCESGSVGAYLSSMPRAVAILYASSLPPPHFLLLSHKRYDFRIKVTEHKMCVLIFSKTFILHIPHSKKHSERYCHKCENVFM